MIKSFKDISNLARKKGPKMAAVLAPEDTEFMNAVKISWEMGYIEPVLIGDTKKMEEAAQKVAFNIDQFKKIPQTEQQAISNQGINMLFSGELPIHSSALYILVNAFDNSLLMSLDFVNSTVLLIRFSR